MKTAPWTKVGPPGSHRRAYIVLGKNGRVKLYALQSKVHKYTIYARREQVEPYMDKYGFDHSLFLDHLQRFREGEHLKFSQVPNFKLDNVRVIRLTQG